MLRLDHVNIRTDKLAETREFFTQVIGLSEGPRPAFSFPGAWLYCGDIAVIHLTGLTEEESMAPAGGAIDHVSFRASGLEETRERLTRSGHAFEEKTIPGGLGQQLFLTDPNDVVIELTFLTVAQPALAGQRSG